jgi:hypothetical protein
MDNGSDSPPGEARRDEAGVALKLAEAQAQIEELVELNRRLRTELGEMTMMWVGAVGAPRRRMHVVRQMVGKLRQAFGVLPPPSARLMNRSVRDYQMLGALSALQQGRHSGLVIPTVELLALGYATEADGGIAITPAGEEVLQGLRATLLNTGQHPVVMLD